MERDIVLNKRLRMMLFDRGYMKAMSEYNMRVLTTDMPRPCNRFMPLSYTVLVDTRNWILFGKEYLGSVQTV